MAANYYKKPDYPAQLHRWLARGRQWDIEYKAYLSNHITHNWIALAVGGADEQRLQWWEDEYSEKLQQSPPRGVDALEPARDYSGNYTHITSANWRNNLQSTRIAFPLYRDFFDEQLAELGLAATLNRYFPTLAEGLSGAAMHAVIHTGWAVDVESVDMAGEGLAYMATAFQPLGTRPPHKPPKPLWSTTAKPPVKAALELLSADAVGELTRSAVTAGNSEAYEKLNRGGFQQRLISFDDPQLPLAEHLNGWGPLGLPDTDEELTAVVEEMAVFAAAALLASNNEFFMLHGLTSLHGVLAVLPHLEPADQRLCLAYWWRAAMAVTIAQDRPGLQKAASLVAQWQTDRAAEPGARLLTEEEQRWWQQARQATFDSNDEHVPKAVYTLWRWCDWGAFCPASQQLFKCAAENVIKPDSSGDLSENLWFNKVKESVKDKELQRYD